MMRFSRIAVSAREFARVGHLPTLLTSLLYFDVCFAVWVLNGTMAPFISAELGFSPAETGLLTSLPIVVGALLRVPIGLLAQRVGRKRAAIASMVILIAGLAIGGTGIESRAGLLAIGTILGVGGASFGVALSLGAGWYPRRYKGLAMGIAGAGNSGAVITMLCAPPLAATLGWRAVYGLAALPVAVALFMLWRWAEEPPDRDPGYGIADCLRLLASRDIWVLALAYALTFGGYIGLTSFLPTLFHQQYAIPAEAVGRYAVLAILAGSLLRIAGGWLADRLGGLRLIRLLTLLIAVSATAAATLPDPLALAAILIACFALMGAGNGAVFQLVPLRFPAATAVASSLVGEIGALVGGTIPAVMGAAQQSVGTFAPGFLLLATMGLGAGAILALVGRQWTRSWLEPGRGTAAAAPLEVVGT
jgi:NNP family nitrate/nitrite transporter-like MFS transporter